MYTLMKSEKSNFGYGVKRPPGYKQMVVGKFALLSDAMAACKNANQQFEDMHYIMNEFGKEYYDGKWKEYYDGKWVD